MSGSTEERVVEIPPESLSADALRGVAEEFVTRQGTDYGERERTLEEKVEDVLRQLRRGEARIVFDLETERVQLVPTAGIGRARGRVDR